MMSGLNDPPPQPVQPAPESEQPDDELEGPSQEGTQKEGHRWARTKKSCRLRDEQQEGEVLEWVENPVRWNSIHKEHSSTHRTTSGLKLIYNGEVTDKYRTIPDRTD